MAKNVVILGGGPAGLAAAWRLAKKGHSVRVLEMSSRVGGMAGGVELNGNIYEFGPHMFHTTDQEILSDIKSIMGSDLITFKRTVKIKFMGEHFDFPLSIADILLKLPFKTIVGSAFSFVFHAVKSCFSKPAVETTETVLLGYYGKVLYEIFFKSYIEQVWGVPPSQFSPEFARQRIPRINVLEALEKIIEPIRRKKSKEVDVDRHVEKEEGEIFTTLKGFSMITDRMAQQVKKHGGTIHLNAKVVDVSWSGRKINSIRVLSEGKETVFECGDVISSLPINVLVKLLNPSPGPEICQAAGNLSFRAIIFVGILVNRRKVLPASFMYFRDTCFNRLMDLEYFGFEIKPSHATILIAEVNCQVGDEVWNNDALAIERTVADLEQEGFIKKSEILETHVFKAPNAYPIYSLGFEKDLKTIRDWIDGTDNLQTIGRQGTFNYINSHIAMKMGYIAADKIAAAAP